MLDPDRDQIEIFVDAIFRHAGDKGFVAVRSFLEHEDRVFRRSIADLAGGLRFLVDVCEDDARRAAQTPKPVVFCPPLAVFTGKDHAREQDVLLGLVLSVECDEHPQQARATLEALLGRATVVVQSGGRWINGGGEPEDKLHLHWRLAKPAQGKDALANLKTARELAARLVGGDPSNVANMPPDTVAGQLASQGHATSRQDRCLVRSEIDLAEALELLRDAAGAATFAGFGFKTNSRLRRRSGSRSLGALGHPERRFAWDDWDRIGMATFAATGGSDVGREAFAKWSAKASKNDPRDREPVAALPDLAAHGSGLARWSGWPASTRPDGLTKRPRRKAIRGRAPRTKARREQAKARSRPPRIRQRQERCG